MTVQTFYFFSKMVVWTAPISTPLKLISIGTVQAAFNKKNNNLDSTANP